MSILNSTINNILSNFIPHETITCDDKNPPWFNKNIINLIKNKNIFYKSHTANENSTDKKEAINPANIRLDEDVLKTSWRRLSSSSSEDVFKASSRRLDQDQYIHLGYTSSRRLQDIFKTSLRRIIKLNCSC